MSEAPLYLHGDAISGERGTLVQGRLETKDMVLQ